LLAFRAPDAFLTPQFWAEDGSLLWLDAYRDGVHAIFKPYAGYLILAPRLIAQIASWFNPAAAPSIYLYAAVLLTAWSAATVAAVMPNPWMGLCFAVALLLPPMPDGEI